MTNPIESSIPSVQTAMIPALPPKAVNLTEQVKQELIDYCETSQRVINSNQRLWVNAATLLVAVSFGVVAGCLLGSCFWGLVLGIFVGTTVFSPIVGEIGMKTKDRSYQRAAEELGNGTLQSFAEKMKIPLNIHTLLGVNKLYIDYNLSLICKARAELIKT